MSNLKPADNSRDQQNGEEPSRPRTRSTSSYKNNHGRYRNKLSTTVISRTAIDLNGKVGYYYDASRDRVLADSSLCSTPSRHTLSDRPLCGFIKKETVTVDSLLNILEIDSSSYLNLLLSAKHNSKEKIHRILFDLDEWNDEHMRILFYRRAYTREKHNFVHNEVQDALSSATHVIDSVSFGVEFIAILEPPDESEVFHMDQYLRELCMALQDDVSANDVEKIIQQLESINMCRIYSNITMSQPLTSIRSLYDWLLQKSSNERAPLTYQLRSILSASQGKDRYHEIDPGTIWTIQSELITLQRSFVETFKKAKSCSDPQLQDDFRLVQGTYDSIKFKIAGLINETHRGKQRQRDLLAVFSDDSYFDFLNSLKQYNDRLTASSNQSEIAENRPVPITSGQEPSQANTIRILLLGETGVGKSTFINALANFTHFRSLEEAMQKEPVVLIPSSFVLTFRHEFKPVSVYIGKANKNEQHNDRGRSVTQQCQTHSIHLRDGHGTLNIIDVPGIGDTRGVDQDRQNINHIISYVNKLRSLDAICILLKPNMSELHASFRLYFTKLFQKFRWPDLQDKVLFCFTNSQTTFFAPGSTMFLLQDLLNEINDPRITLDRSNWFCFDSESFRYLAARRQGVKIALGEEKNYRDSWAACVEETDRFLKRLNTLQEIAF